MAKDGSALGVTVTRGALLTHCRSLTTACHYKEGEYSGYILYVFANISVHVVWIVLCLCDIYINFFVGEVVVCTEDPKKSIGLWHGIMAVSWLSLFFFSPPSPPSFPSSLPSPLNISLFFTSSPHTHRLPIMVYMLYLCLQVSCQPFLRSGST